MRMPRLLDCRGSTSPGTGLPLLETESKVSRSTPVDLKWMKMAPCSPLAKACLRQLATSSLRIRPQGMAWSMPSGMASMSVEMMTRESSALNERRMRWASEGMYCWKSTLVHALGLVELFVHQRHGLDALLAGA